MSSYEEFMAKYSALNIVRNELGGLSIAGRSPDRIYSEQTVDIKTVWLGYDEHTRLDTDMRVSITEMARGCPQTNWLIDPLDGRLEPEMLGDFEDIRLKGLIGISAVKAYMQLPQKYQRSLGWIVEDRSSDMDIYTDTVSEVAVIQELIQAGCDPSVTECLTLFDHVLRNAQNTQSMN